MLDLMSSWVSHLPPEVKYSRVVGHGMNAAELQKNKQLDDYFVRNLNAEPSGWALGDQSMDAVVCCVRCGASATMPANPPVLLCRLACGRLYAVPRIHPPDDKLRAMRCCKQESQVAASCRCQNEQLNRARCSVQYMQQPEKVFSEIYRVLKPGGVCIMTFSNRQFYEKAISAWRDGSGYSRSGLIKSYFQAVEGFTQPEAVTEVCGVYRVEFCLLVVIGKFQTLLYCANSVASAMHSRHSRIRIAGVTGGCAAREQPAGRAVEQVLVASIKRPILRCTCLPQLQTRRRMSEHCFMACIREHLLWLLVSASSV